AARGALRWMSPANFMVAPAARRARLVSGLANGIARERRAPAERPKGMGGRAQAATGIVAHRPEDVKKPGMPAAMSVGPAWTRQPGYRFGRSRAAPGGWFSAKRCYFT